MARAKLELPKHLRRSEAPSPRSHSPNANAYKSQYAAFTSSRAAERRRLKEVEAQVHQKEWDWPTIEDAKAPYPSFGRAMQGLVSDEDSERSSEDGEGSGADDFNKHGFGFSASAPSGSKARHAMASGRQRNKAPPFRRNQKTFTEALKDMRSPDDDLEWTPPVQHTGRLSLSVKTNRFEDEGEGRSVPVSSHLDVLDLLGEDDEEMAGADPVVVAQTRKAAQSMKLFMKGRTILEGVSRVCERYHRFVSAKQYRDLVDRMSNGWSLIGPLLNTLDEKLLNSTDEMNDTLASTLHSVVRHKVEAQEFAHMAEQNELKADWLDLEDAAHEHLVHDYGKLLDKSKKTLKGTVATAQAGASKLAQDIFQKQEERKHISKASQEYEAELYEHNRRERQMRIAIMDIQARREDRLRKQAEKVEQLRQELLVLCRRISSTEKQVEDTMARCAEMLARLEVKLKKKMLPQIPRMLEVARETHIREHECRVQNARLAKESLLEEIAYLKEHIQATRKDLGQSVIVREVHDIRLTLLEAKCAKVQSEVRAREWRQHVAAKLADGPEEVLPAASDPKADPSILKLVHQEVLRQQRWLAERSQRFEINQKTAKITFAPSLCTPVQPAKAISRVIREIELAKRVVAQMTDIRNNTPNRRAMRVAMKAVEKFKTLLLKEKGPIEALVPEVVQEVALEKRCKVALDGVLLREQLDCLDAHYEAPLGEDKTVKMATFMQQLSGLTVTNHSVSELLKSWDEWREVCGSSLDCLGSLPDRFINCFQDLQLTVEIAMACMRWFTEGVPHTGVLLDVLLSELSWLPELADAVAERCGELKALFAILQDTSFEHEDDEAALTRAGHVVGVFLSNLRNLYNDDVEWKAEAWMLRLQQALRKKLLMQQATGTALKWYGSKCGEASEDKKSLWGPMQHAMEVVSCLLQGQELKSTGAEDRVLESEMNSLVRLTAQRVLREVGADDAQEAAVLVVASLQRQWDEEFIPEMPWLQTPEQAAAAAAAAGSEHEKQEAGSGDASGPARVKPGRKRWSVGIADFSSLMVPLTFKSVNSEELGGSLAASRSGHSRDGMSNRSSSKDKTLEGDSEVGQYSFAVTQDMDMDLSLSQFNPRLSMNGTATGPESPSQRAASVASGRGSRLSEGFGPRSSDPNSVAKRNSTTPGLDGQDEVGVLDEEVQESSSEASSVEEFETESEGGDPSLSIFLPHEITGDEIEYELRADASSGIDDLKQRFSMVRKQASDKQNQDLEDADAGPAITEHRSLLVEQKVSEKTGEWTYTVTVEKEGHQAQVLPDNFRIIPHTDHPAYADLSSPENKGDASRSSIKKSKGFILVKEKQSNPLAVLQRMSKVLMAMNQIPRSYLEHRRAGMTITEDFPSFPELEARLARKASTRRQGKTQKTRRRRKEDGSFVRESPNVDADAGEDEDSEAGLTWDEIQEKHRLESEEKLRRVLEASEEAKAKAQEEYEAFAAKKDAMTTAVYASMMARRMKHSRAQIIARRYKNLWSKHLLRQAMQEKNLEEIEGINDTDVQQRLETLSGGRGTIALADSKFRDLLKRVLKKNREQDGSNEDRLGVDAEASETHDTLPIGRRGSVRMLKGASSEFGIMSPRGSLRMSPRQSGRSQSPTSPTSRKSAASPFEDLLPTGSGSEDAGPRQRLTKEKVRESLSRAQKRRARHGPHAARAPSKKGAEVFAARDGAEEGPPLRRGGSRVGKLVRGRSSLCPSSPTAAAAAAAAAASKNEGKDSKRAAAMRQNRGRAVGGGEGVGAGVGAGSRNHSRSATDHASSEESEGLEIEAWHLQSQQASNDAGSRTWPDSADGHTHKTPDEEVRHKNHRLGGAIGKHGGKLRKGGASDRKVPTSSEEDDPQSVPTGWKAKAGWSQDSKQALLKSQQTAHKRWRGAGKEQPLTEEQWQELKALFLASQKHEEEDDEGMEMETMSARQRKEWDVRRRRRTFMKKFQKDDEIPQEILLDFARKSGFFNAAGEFSTAHNPAWRARPESVASPQKPKRNYDHRIGQEPPRPETAAEITRRKAEEEYHQLAQWVHDGPAGIGGIDNTLLSDALLKHMEEDEELAELKSRELSVSAPSSRRVRGGQRSLVVSPEARGEVIDLPKVGPDLERRTLNLLPMALHCSPSLDAGYGSILSSMDWMEESTREDLEVAALSRSADEHRIAEDTLMSPESHTSPHWLSALHGSVRTQRNVLDAGNAKFRALCEAASRAEENAAEKDATPGPDNSCGPMGGDDDGGLLRKAAGDQVLSFLTSTNTSSVLLKGAPMVPSVGENYTKVNRNGAARAATPRIKQAGSHRLSEASTPKATTGTNASALPGIAGKTTVSCTTSQESPPRAKSARGGAAQIPSLKAWNSDRQWPPPQQLPPTSTTKAAAVMSTALFMQIDPNQRKVGNAAAIMASMALECATASCSPDRKKRRQ